MNLGFSYSTDVDYEYTTSVMKNGDIKEVLQHELVKGKNYFENDLDYWQDQSSTIMPYLPFFSNCLGFD
jgi:hypothetical protein